MLVFGVAALLLFGVAPAWAVTDHVMNLNDAGAGSLRDVVANAAAGDTIVFGVPGTIALTSGEIAFDKTLTMTGPGASSLTIDAGANSRIFDVGPDGGLTVSGVTFTGGSDTSGVGGGAILSQGAPLTVSGATFVSNDASAAAGGAIFTDLFLGMTSGPVGLSVTNSTFRSNTAASGGAISATGALATITGSTFTTNTADGDLTSDDSLGRGGAIDVDLSALSVISSDFSGNHAGGADTHSATQGDGGAVDGRSSDITVMGGSFTANSAGGDGSGAGGGSTRGRGAGGAIELKTSEGAPLEITRATFTDNRAGGVGGQSDTSGVGRGGAVHTLNVPVNVHTSSFDGNTAGGAGGGGTSSGFGAGGAVDTQDSGADASVTADTSSSFEGNTAGGAGGGGASSGSGEGGAVDSDDDVTATNSTFSANRAGGDGGDGQESAEGTGGALEVGRHALVQSSTFTGNDAGGKGGGGAEDSGFGDGGAIDADALDVSGGTFSSNLAGGAGGAAKDGGEGLGGAIETNTATIGSSAFTGNHAGGAGGSGDDSGFADGAAVETNDVDVSGSVFAANVAGGPGAAGDFSGAGYGAAIETGIGTVASSRFTGNIAGGPGGSGLQSGSAFGAVLFFDAASVSSSTFDGNRAGGAGGDGDLSGASFGSALSAVLDGASFSLTNSTVAGNRGGGPAAGSAIDGGTAFGAVDVEAGAATLTADTIDGNSSASSTVMANGVPTTAGVGSDSGDGTFTVVGSIVADNTAPGGVSANCWSPVLFSSFSLEGPAGSTSCGFDLPSAEPRLAALADNGGPALPGGFVLATQALGAGSPAIDVVPKASCPAKDERGVARPDGGELFCDAGAFESSGAGRSSLSLMKAASPGTVLDGQSVTYTLTAGNGGPDPATAPVFTDTLPAGQSFVAAGSTPGCSASGQVVTCPAQPDIPLIGTESVTIVAKTARAGTGQVDHASVSSVSSPADGTATASVDVMPAADLSLTKSASPTTVLHGQNVTYSLTVANAGPDPAAAPVVIDTLPAGQTFQAAGSSPGCSAAGQTVRCTLAGSVTVGSPVTLHVVAQAGVVGNAQMDVASVSSATPDTMPGNNSASASVNVVPAADLSLTKTASPSPVIAGQRLTYTLTVHNAGPDPATGVKVVDPLPSGQVFQGASPGCSASGQTVTCPLGDIPSGGNGSAMIVVLAPAPPAVANTASVSATTADPNPPNNSGSATASITGSCTSSPTGTIAGPLTVPAGTFLCLGSGVTVTGSITVAAGGALTLSGARVNGSVSATGAQFVTMCGSAVSGAVVIKNSVLIVSLGGLAGGGCPGNILGSLILTNNTGGVIVLGNTIGGSTSVTGNQGASPLADATPDVGGNHIAGGLACSSNVPSVINDGLTNTTTGAKLGQCASL